MPELDEAFDNCYFKLFIILMRKLRFRERKTLVQSHIASK